MICEGIMAGQDERVICEGIIGTVGGEDMMRW